MDDREYDIWQAENDPLSGARAFVFCGLAVVIIYVIATWAFWG